MTEEKRHPIQVVARRSGLTADVLRAWEKRYNAVEPARSAGSRRLYSDADIERLRMLREAVESGRRIGDVVRLPAAELSALVAEDRAETLEVRIPQAAEDDSIARILEEAVDAVQRMDAEALRIALQRAVVENDPTSFLEGVAAPLMRTIGSMWEAGELEPSHEHLASSVVLQILGSMVATLHPRRGAPNVVVATPPGQKHEIGAMLASAAAAVEGWRVTYLGSDLPAEDIAKAASRTGASAVALSIALDTPELVNDLDILSAELPDDTPILLGGRGSPSSLGRFPRGRVVKLGDLPSLRAVLQTLALRRK